MLSASCRIETSGDTAILLSPALRADRQDGAGSRSNDAVSDGAERPPDEPRPAVGAHHDQARPRRDRLVDNLFLGDSVGEHRLDLGAGNPALRQQILHRLLGAPAGARLPLFPPPPRGPRGPPDPPPPPHKE